MSIVIKQGTIKDTKKIMSFIDIYWRKDHILAKNEEFFLYEFQNGEMLNIVVGMEDEAIVGIFGFFYYNSLDIPDMAGSMWKTHPEVKDQLLGIKLRDYFKKNINHNFFATPGPGLHMQNVYKILRMNWFEMNQYYLVNDQVSKYELMVNPEIKNFNKQYNNTISICEAKSDEELNNYQFDSDTLPMKDMNYLKKRYFEHPIYDYDIYYVQNDQEILNILVFRTSVFKANKAYRLVDFFGPLKYLKEITTYFYNFIVKENYEYIDFINYGYDHETMLEAGFSLLDFKSNTIIPNYFEPFVQKNVPIYCVCDKTTKNYRQHKADGDMDRPSMWEKAI